MSIKNFIRKNPHIVAKMVVLIFFLALINTEGIRDISFNILITYLKEMQDIPLSSILSPFLLLFLLGYIYIIAAKLFIFKHSLKNNRPANYHDNNSVSGGGL